ncbi:hypothetical protein ACJQWY_01155 [Weissella kandleri]
MDVKTICKVERYIDFLIDKEMQLKSDARAEAIASLVNSIKN